MTKLQRYTIICIIFLAFLPLVYQFIRPSLSAEELFSKHFVAQKILVTREGYRSNLSKEEHPEKRKQLRQEKTLYYEAVESYSKEEYARAALQFEQYLENAPNNRKDVALHLGIAYLSTTQLEAAEEQFQYLLKNGSANKKQDAEWYLVLTLLKKKDVEQVRQELTNILTQLQPHAYEEKAQILLEELRQQYQP